MSGVATRLSAAEPRAVFTQCYALANLPCVDTIKRRKIMQDALDTCEITNDQEITCS